ncbi:unnamed protein product, partial [Prorocentrum cordatum]
VVKSGTRGLWRQLREVRTDIEQGLPRATDRDASWAPHLLPTRGGAAGPGQAEDWTVGGRKVLEFVKGLADYTCASEAGGLGSCRLILSDDVRRHPRMPRCF